MSIKYACDICGNIILNDASISQWNRTKPFRGAFSINLKATYPMDVCESCDTDIQLFIKNKKEEKNNTMEGTL